MKKTTAVAAILGLALFLGSVTRSEAFCFIFCGGDGDSSNSEIEKSNVVDSAVAQGKGNTSLKDVANSSVVNGNVSTNQSNSIGAIGFNKGDISQSNAANISGQTNIQGNDMRDMSISKGGGR